MKKGILGVMLCLALLLSALSAVISAPLALAADPTTSITVTKYASDGTTILDQTSVTIAWMEANLTPYGDGVTHYYHQGPTFDLNNMWDPGEMVNIDSRDYGAVIGTNVKDLCNLIGGASAGDVIKIASPDGFSKSFDYEDVYTPEAKQGKLVITWYRADDGLSSPADGFGYPPDYNTGMRLVFFAETTNPEGKYVFGNWDMHETLAESRWHHYDDGTTEWPSSSGLSAKWVSDVIIYSSEPAPATPTPTPTSDGGCFIATAAYGTSTAEEIDTLRAFRDEVLLESTVGSQLVEWYYQTSPPVADFISEHEGLRTLVREFVIDPIARLVEATEAFWLN